MRRTILTLIVIAAMGLTTQAVKADHRSHNHNSHNHHSQSWHQNYGSGWHNHAGQGWYNGGAYYGNNYNYNHCLPNRTYNYNAYPYGNYNYPYNAYGSGVFFGTPSFRVRIGF